MRIHRLATDRLADAAAAALAGRLREAVERRGRASVAFSGGRTPAGMLDALAGHELPWSRIHVLQTDERIAPDGDADRNLTLLVTHLTDAVGLPDTNLHPVPVGAGSPAEVAAGYAHVLADVCAGVLDVVHLGLGTDGHTASLIPGDPAVDTADRDVAATGPHTTGTSGPRRRITLTLRAIDRARRRMWLVAGDAKRPALTRLLDGDRTIPAGRVRRDATDLYTDLHSDLDIPTPPTRRSP